MDLIEVDAASRTKVEDTRDLLENVQYLPSRGRYKIYLIDEVHMLSTHSFNALLKTLEEPPEHVKFLLATTDPQKLPVTVLSRCLQFNLQALAGRASSRRGSRTFWMPKGSRPSPPRCVCSPSLRTAACVMRCRCSTSCWHSAAAQDVKEADARACWARWIVSRWCGLARLLAAQDLKRPARSTRGRWSSGRPTICRCSMSW